MDSSRFSSYSGGDDRLIPVIMAMLQKGQLSIQREFHFNNKSLSAYVFCRQVYKGENKCLSATHNGLLNSFET